MIIRDWNDQPIEVAKSVGGVLALRNAWEGVVRGDVAPWPPPELVQKCYQSRQARAFREADHTLATAASGFYSDIQSVHSEDAVTWSLFGPLAYADARTRGHYCSALLAELSLETPTISPANIWLWRRLPHPDSLVPGGPEIDFGIQSERVLILGEAKWRSSVGTAQGVDGLKDQIQLRVEFCEKFGAALYPGVEQFAVLLVGQQREGPSASHATRSTERVRVVSASWEQLGALAANPWREEFLAQLRWRQEHSLAI